MRGLALAASLMLAAVVVAPAAQAGIKVKQATKTYSISGRTGMALLDQMDRKGPKHGFLTRAIAQTSYSVSWTIEWGETDRACRLKRADGVLDVTYTYPKVANGLSGAMQRRWVAFMAGVKRHEEEHGRIARQMARAAEKALAGLTVPNDRGCRKARAEAQRRMSAVYRDYEARQIRYDTREHRAGGPVEGLIGALVSRR